MLCLNIAYFLLQTFCIANYEYTFKSIDNLKKLLRTAFRNTNLEPI